MVLAVQHLLEQVKLCQSHSDDGDELEDGEVLHLVLMGSDDLGVNGLPFLLEQLVLRDLLQLFPHVQQSSV